MSRAGLSAFSDVLTTELTPIAGWTFAYTVNTDIVSTSVTGSGSVTHDAPMVVVNSGAAINSGATVQTKKVLRYIPGIGGLIRFTAIFDDPVAGNSQLVGLTNGDNSLAIGFVGEDFGVLRKSGGTSDFITSPQLNWVPPLDFTNGNVFVIQYQWLGFGPIRFLYEDGDGDFEIFHQIRYPNTATVTSLKNPTMYVFAESTNTTNDTNVVLKSPSAMAFREGAMMESLDPLLLSRTFEGTATVTTEVPVLSVRAKATYNSITNMIQPIPSVLSMVTDGTKSVTFRCYRGGTLTGGSWSDYNTNNSSLESDTTASAVSSGTLVASFQLSKADSLTVKLENWGIELEPNETITVTATSAVSNIVGVTLTMKEGF